MEFPFYDAPDTATIVCSHIINGENHISYVFHDEDDGMWQFLCDKAHNEDEARIVSLKYAFEIDHSVGKLKDMPLGFRAERKSPHDDWIIRRK